MDRGKVYLIGAGPGDPGLLTLKGRGLLESADVVVYDYLASEELLSFCRPGAEKIYVGKQGGEHTLSQAQISGLLVEKAREGALVARLKGGDPFIFGRGGEEAEVLWEAGVPFEVVPGVSSAVAAPAYAGIPLTHRRYASSVAIVTGHEDPDKDSSQIVWEHLARGVDTLVFLMGVKTLAETARRLLQEGRDPATPCAVVRWGTLARQRTVTGPLDGIAEAVRQAGLQAPAVLVVGDVVRLRDRLSWFEKAPLFGRRVVVTRSREQASELAERLRAAGADPIECPAISVGDPGDWQGCDAALDRLGSYDWTVFTSPNGVRFFLRRLLDTGRDIRDLRGPRIAAIGPGTAAALERLGVRVDLIPGEYRAEGLVEAFGGEAVRGKRFLLARAQEARDVLPRQLAQMGAAVDVAAVYRTVMPEGAGEAVRALLEGGAVDVVTFTSSSTVTNFARMMGDAPLARLLQGVVVACIGPITAETAHAAGIQPSVVARTYTIEGLVAALVDHFHGAA
jgi:uroporphyrinogen III methyltransferase/synthase